MSEGRVFIIPGRVVEMLQKEEGRGVGRERKRARVVVHNAPKVHGAWFLYQSLAFVYTGTLCESNINEIVKRALNKIIN